MKTNTLRNLMFLGVVALPTAVLAAPPAVHTPVPGVNFGDTYSYSGDSVVYNAAVIPVDWTVGANPIVDTNFMQVTLTSPTGETYFQTIIGDGGDVRGTAGEEFFDTESWVRVQATNGTGIAVRQIVDDRRLGNTGTLTSDSVIYTGGLEFFNPATTPTVYLEQGVTDSMTGLEVDATFETNFVYSAHLRDLNGAGDLDVVGQLSLDQIINSNDAGTATQDLTGDGFITQADHDLTNSFQDRFDFASVSSQVDGESVPTQLSSALSLSTQVNLGIAVDDQDFRYEKRVGVGDATGTGIGLVYTDGITVLSGVDNIGSGTLVDGDFSAGGSVDWVVGDTVDMVQISQSVDNAGDFGFASIADRANQGGLDNDFPTTADEYQSIFSLANGGLPDVFFDASPGSNPFD